MTTPETSRRPVYADPDFSYEYDEDGVKDSINAGWDISFGCRLNVVQDRDGAPHVSVSMSDQDRRDGCSSRSTTREQIRQFAYHLLKLTDEMDDITPPPSSTEDTPAAHTHTDACMCEAEPGAVLFIWECRHCGGFDEGLPCRKRCPLSEVASPGTTGTPA